MKNKKKTIVGYVYNGKTFKSLADLDKFLNEESGSEVNFCDHPFYDVDNCPYIKTTNCYQCTFENISKNNEA